MRLSSQRTGFGVVVTMMTLAGSGAVKGDETWRGLTVALEHRCAPYHRDDYPYSQSVETRIIAGMGGRVYGPYTGRHFASRRNEAPVRVRRAEPDAGGARGEPAPEEREGRGRVDAADEPLLVRRPGRGGETEVRADGRRAGGPRPRRGPVGCRSTEMVVTEGRGQVAETAPSAGAPNTGDALSRWDTNGNGRITCKEARQHGIAPVHREHPAYRFMRDGDGVVCE